MMKNVARGGMVGEEFGEEDALVDPVGVVLQDGRGGGDQDDESMGGHEEEKEPEPNGTACFRECGGRHQLVFGGNGGGFALTAVEGFFVGFGKPRDCEGKVEDGAFDGVPAQGGEQPSDGESDEGSGRGVKKAGGLQEDENVEEIEGVADAAEIAEGLPGEDFVEPAAFREDCPDEEPAEEQDIEAIAEAVEGG